MAMREHTFERTTKAGSVQAPDPEGERDELRCHTTEWLRAEHGSVVHGQQRLKARELAIVAVLDERRAIPDPTPGISARTVRDTVEVARSLVSLPAIAARVHAGDLSWDQIKPLVEVATPETDAEWAERALHWAPADLQRQARAAKVVTAEDAAARREARELRCWSDPEAGMVAGRFRLPDVDGILVKSVLEEMAERMRPTKGQPWDRLEHRMADAFVDLCQNYADITPTRRSRPLVVVHTTGNSAEVDGIPIASETLDEIRDEARVIEQRDDVPTIDYGPGRFAIPAELARIIEHRDTHCRYPGCERTWGLQRHHLTPVVWDGTTSRTTVVRLCSEHHRRMEPHGTERLVGDPDLPDGLRLISVGVSARAGPAP
jgi:hypothetical protein